MIRSWGMHTLLLAGLFAAAAAAQDLVMIPVRPGTQPFLLGKTEVTQESYQAITGQNPSVYPGPTRPVENVSWWDAVRYCNRRSQLEGLSPVYDPETGQANPLANGYRLPTEAEWSAAAGTEPSPGRLAAADTKSVERLREPLAKGTAPVASYPANRLGLHDLMGNVWEWCQNWFDPAAPDANPSLGVERALRGGSFLTPASGWTKGFRSSFPPDRRSRYTGFRVARNAPAARPAVLRSAVGLREKWLQALGQPAGPAPTPRFERVEAYAGVELGYLRVESDYAEKILILRPANAGARPLPVVIVPFYDVDAPAGRNLGGRNFAPPGVRNFAQHAVDRGYMAVAIRWFGESYGESYSEAVANLALRHPGVTGLGKWVWDARRLVDYLHTRPDVDRGRVAMIGHSLGGKMTLYAAALDPRIHVAVASEPGIGLAFSNYEDFWYWGEKIRQLPPGTDQHELVGLLAPRPFFLIAGDSADNDQALDFLAAARPLYREPERLGFYNHRTGHSPTAEAVGRAMDWITRWFGAAAGTAGK